MDATDHRTRLRRQQERARGYTRFQFAINVVALVAFGGLTIWTVMYLVDIQQRSPANHLGWIIAAAVVMAIIAADLISGVVHWAADNWGSADWPLIGGFVQPFRNHHVDPKEMTQHGFVESHGDHAVITLPPFWWAVCAQGDSSWCIFWGVFWIGVAYAVLLTADIHGWAHSDEPPRLARWCQRARLILPPAHHARHHAPPHRENYCITTGWMNAPLRWLKVFPIMEWILTKLTGAVPVTRHDGASTAERAKLPNLS